MPGSRVEVTGTRIEQVAGDLVIDAIDPVRELSTLVLPALDNLEEGAPIVVAIDGLDEASLAEDKDFLTVVQKLVRHVGEQRRTRVGAGRLRVILTSQPEVPVYLSSVLGPAVIDLSEPRQADHVDLRSFVDTLLGPLPAVERGRLAELISEHAGGIWVIAFYIAQAIIEDVAAGRPVPARLQMPVSLGEAYQDALGRARSRLGGTGPRWTAARQLVGLVAAAQDVGSGLPPDLAALALGTDESVLDELLAAMRSILSRAPDSTLRFFHGDFGRWVIGGGLGGAVVEDAHNRLGEVLTEAGSRSWRLAGSYCARYVGPHALAAAECSIDKVTHVGHVDRCLRLFGTESGSPTTPRQAGGSLSWTG